MHRARGLQPTEFIERSWPWALGGAILCLAVTTLLKWPHSAVPSRFFLAFGFIAVWRYSWGTLHFIRGLLYLGFVFPRRRAAAAALGPAHPIEHIFGVICSFRIPETQFRAVYRSLIANCISSAIPATLVASVTSDRDCAILAELLEEAGNPEALRIIVQFQRGDGKREAMAMALRAIAREQPSRNSVTVLLDGDVVLSPCALAKCIDFMAANPKLAAVTTNNDAKVEGGNLVRHWYQLRFAQRHLLMSSLSLSGRLLVLTGRFSLYRTSEVIKPAFINIIERDSISHWLHGRIKLLSGDDKSAWHQVLKDGGRMAYLPDVLATSFEAMPGNRGFVAESTSLMMRWFGNMRRENGRAIGLGVKRCGPFLWWCLVDQRISPWTTQLGCAMAIVTLLRGHPDLLIICAAWVVMSRTILSAAYGAIYGGFHPAWPMLLLYTQYWGSALKIYMAFHPYLQSWTRQGISRKESSKPARLAATCLHLFSIFFIAVAAVSVARFMGES